MKNRCWILLLVVALLLCGCSKPAAENPEQALIAMIEVRDSDLETDEDGTRVLNVTVKLPDFADFLEEAAEDIEDEKTEDFEQALFTRALELAQKDDDLERMEFQINLTAHCPDWDDMNGEEQAYYIQKWAFDQAVDAFCMQILSDLLPNDFPQEVGAE